MVWITIDRSLKTSLTKQVYNQISEKILSNELKSGAILPPSRLLAQELSISRNIVIEVYEQLVAEGYLATRPGAGTFVAEGVSFKRYSNLTKDTSPKKMAPASAPDPEIIDFAIGIPDLDNFPYNKWGSYVKKGVIDSEHSYLGYIDSNGIYELRMVLADFLIKSKGIRCKPEQIIITSGALHGLSIVSEVLMGQFDKVIIEDPSFNEIQKVFTHNGYQLSPIPIDKKGIQTDLLPKKPNREILIVTPSHHFPIGCVLPVNRRIQLVEFARKNNTYIIENDYDSEYRYKGIPISSIQMFDPDHVIHIGSFNETLYPSIRLGYIVVPNNLVGPCINHIKIKKDAVSSLLQLAILDFIKNGELEKHIHKMKKLYKKKRDFMIRTLQTHFNDIVISGDSAGLYLLAEFAGVGFDQKLIEKLKNHKVCVYSVAEHYMNNQTQNNKILLGYGNLNFEEIEEGIVRLKNIIKR